MNFLQPDPRWELWGVKTHEDFVRQFLISGKFHSSVPLDISDSYLTVERLLVYSYFFYPLVDEAFAKATSIFEAAVKQRVDQLGIETKDFEPLAQRLKKLQAYCSPRIMEEYDRMREVRNMFAHRSANTLAGATVLHRFVGCINMINYLFLDNCHLIDRDQNLEGLKESSRQFDDGYFIYENGLERILVSSCSPLAMGILKCPERSLWMMQPIPNKTELEMAEDIPLPFFITLEQVSITAEGLDGVNSVSGEDICVIKTVDPRNTDRIDLFNQNWQASIRDNPSIIAEFNGLSNTKLWRESSEFLYQCW